jgi:short-subunit dehydrogenase
MDIAIITGASSGLGKAYVERISKKWPEIKEIWAIARRKERLEELKKLVPIVRPMPMDLGDEDALHSFETLLQNEKPHIRLLINAAGFAKLGNYQAVTRQESDLMIDINCKAAVDMTQIALPYMQKGDRIMEICSTAAFQPFQHLAVYAASKAFLYRYSRALRVELLPRGISVTAVCPYWIKDTEFIPVAKETEKKKPVIRHYVLASHVRSVSWLSLCDARHRFAVSTPGPICFCHRIVAKFVPSELMMGLWALLRRL